MKNQNDMIWSIVSIVVALIVAGVCFGTQRQPVAPPAAPMVNTAPPQYPTTQVVMGNSLPKGSDNRGGNASGGPAGIPGRGGNGASDEPGTLSR